MPVGKMDVSPDTQRLVGTLFLVFNAAGIFLYGTGLPPPLHRLGVRLNLCRWPLGSRARGQPKIWLAVIFSVTSAVLLLQHESDYHSVKLACVGLPLLSAALMPTRERGNLRNTVESAAMLLPLLLATIRVARDAHPYPG